MFMVFLVLDDPDRLDALLAAWKAAGVGGATIIESTGIHRRLKHLVPMRYFLPAGDVEEDGHLTLLAIVESEAMVQACLQATETVTGSLDLPNSGIFAAWPLLTVKGLPAGEG